jgi:DNA polymerase I-like protein with 3'-5' exonuclease and polymerase domains
MNLQQIPQAFKQYIKSDKYLVYADFAQLELRSLCALIGETVLEGLFREKGSDLHSYVRDSLFGNDQTVSDAGRGNSLRQIAKIYNFASLYGAGHNTIGNVLLKYTGMHLPEAELKKHKSKWLDTFPMIREWHNKNVRLWQKKSVLKTTMGRKYIAKLPTDANNIMNSGTAAEVAKLALVYMDKEMDISKMLMFVHDSYTSEYDTFEEATEAAETMARLMNKAWYDITAHCVIPDIPMPVNAYVGKDWGTIDKYPLGEYVYDKDGGEWLQKKIG